MSAHAESYTQREPKMADKTQAKQIATMYEGIVMDRVGSKAFAIWKP